MPVVGDVELFAQALQDRHPSPRHSIPPKVLAVTGSNGKSTVTAMAGEICRAAGRETVVAGNIGLPVLDALAAIEDGGRAPDVFVLELSSFQLESTHSLEPDAATVLNLTEDHLDRYDGMADYAAAKARVFAGGGVQVLNRDDRRSMDMARAGRARYTFGPGEPRAETEWGVAPARRRQCARARRARPDGGVRIAARRAAQRGQRARGARARARDRRRPTRRWRGRCALSRGCRTACRKWRSTRASCFSTIPRAPTSARPWRR